MAPRLLSEKRCGKRRSVALIVGGSGGHRVDIGQHDGDGVIDRQVALGVRCPINRGEYFARQRAQRSILNEVNREDIYAIGLAVEATIDPSLIRGVDNPRAGDRRGGDGFTGNAHRGWHRDSHENRPDAK